jgi:hypothetical protein
MSKRTHNSKLRSRNSIRTLALRWVSAVTVAGVLGAAAIYEGVGLASGALLLPGVLVAAVVLAALETWALGPVLGSERGLFFAATAIGAGWGALAAILLGTAGIMGWAGPLGGLSIAGALSLGGALIGLLLSGTQAIVLRKRLPGSGLAIWIGTHTLAGALAGVVMPLASSLLPGDDTLLKTMLAALPAGLLAGLITGAAVWRVPSSQ